MMYLFSASQAAKLQKLTDSIGPAENCILDEPQLDIGFTWRQSR